MNVTHVNVSESDFEELADLRVAAMRESLERVGRFDPQRARDRLRASYAPEHTRVIEIDGQRVGFFTVRPTADGLSLDHLYIHPTFQNRGIGGIVMHQVLAQADGIGMAISVGALRESASNAFYQRHGFIKSHETEFDVHYTRLPHPKS